MAAGQDLARLSLVVNDQLKDEGIGRFADEPLAVCA
jgi:hypothetical protein